MYSSWHLVLVVGIFCASCQAWDGLASIYVQYDTKLFEKPAQNQKGEKFSSIQFHCMTDKKAEVALRYLSHTLLQ